MKILRFLSTIFLFAGGLILSVRAESSQATDQPSLQMHVAAPYVTDLIQRDDVVDALFWRVRDGIRSIHRGLDIKEVDGDEPAKGVPVLALTLLHWRQTRMGDIECQFSVEYRSADGKRSLGNFEGTTSSIARSPGFASDDFGRAAEDAGRQLGRALREKKLIPDSRSS